MSATTSFALPIDVPWYLIAASPDMMATTFCENQTSSDDAQAYPPAWHSSLAIYAYEPSPDDLPAEMCNQKITYLKVTCSITGYQPTPSETSTLAGPPYNFSSPYDNPPQSGQSDQPPYELQFPNIPGGNNVDNAQVFGDFSDDYLACYGVVLNVKVLPSVTTLPQTSPTGTETYAFNQGEALPNPYQALSDGLTFTLFRGGGEPKAIDVTGAAGVWGIRLLPNYELEIDLPLSTNVELQLKAPGKRANNGAITAYEFGTQVFQTDLVAQTAGSSTAFSLGNVSVTRVVLSSVDDATAFLSISYSSLERPVTLADYPHIIDFEPKTRDLYQAATDESEVLTGSNSAVNIGKSLTNASSSQMGLSLSGGFSQPGGPNVSAGLTGSWGSTSSDSTNTAIDQSRERRETQGSTTSLSQQYNLLTGYHSGTNRAAFIMLPRPHLLQATDYRTFIRGLRMIEGLQDFILIISRPLSMPGICVEATLETGHLPESTTASDQVIPAATQNEMFSQGVHDPWSYNTGPNATHYTYSLSGQWVINSSITAAPAVNLPPGALVAWQYLQPGVFYTYGPSAGQNAQSAEYQQAVKTLTISPDSSSPTSLQGDIYVTAQGGGLGSPGTAAIITVTFLICETQPSAPFPSQGDEEPVVVASFLVTSRDLCVCINSCSTSNCVNIGPTEQVPYSQSPGPTDESGSVISAASGTQTGPAAASGSSANPTTPILSSSGPAAAASVRTRPSAHLARSEQSRAGASLTRSAVPVAATQRQHLKRSKSPPAPQRPSARSSIVYEAKIKLPSGVLYPHRLQQSRTPAARELMHKIHHHMVSNWRLPQRRPHGAVGFLESDYFCERVWSRLPKEHLSQRAADLPGISREIARQLGNRATVGDLLKLDFAGIQKHAKLNATKTAALRRSLLGFVPVQPAQHSTQRSTDPTSSGSPSHAQPSSTPASSTRKSRPRRRPKE